jgi:hypothetical protein
MTADDFLTALNRLKSYSIPRPGTQIYSIDAAREMPPSAGTAAYAPAAPPSAVSIPAKVIPFAVEEAIRLSSGLLINIIPGLVPGGES